jgi:SAM-dependent methyltransferase
MIQSTLLSTLRKTLVDPRLENFDQDDDKRIQLHNEILSSKKMMKDVFEEFYRLCIATTEKYFCKEGKELEIGSGVSFFKSIRPELITSDIVPASHLDLLLNAQDMVEIEDASLRAIYALNVFHHLEKPREFFNELKRVLKPGGGCILIEPFHGTIARPFYRNLHASEHFNPDQEKWESTEQMGAMSNANQALSYIIFVRDRAVFEEEFPELEIVYSKPIHNYIRYLCSGGLNFRQLLPNFAAPLLKAVETVLKPIAYHTALHYQIVIRKRP